MRYRDFIEDWFEIDDAKTGELVPCKLNKTQRKYYEGLVNDYGIERGLAVPAREIILKARRQGFSSLVLALFAADDILSEHATETHVISYKDEATKIFTKRYKGYVKAYFRKRWGVMDEGRIWAVDNGNELILRHNGARFYCGTASARTAGRGGVVHKLLFSEIAHYPDVERITAREMVEGTLRQVDINAGWVFAETTANGYGNHFEKMWSLASGGLSRFKPRFYGWREFYTQEEFGVIASEFTDKQILKQEYPETPEEAFISTGSSYFDNEKILEYMKRSLEPLYLASISYEDKLVRY